MSGLGGRDVEKSIGREFFQSHCILQGSKGPRGHLRFSLRSSGNCVSSSSPRTLVVCRTQRDCTVVLAVPFSTCSAKVFSFPLVVPSLAQGFQGAASQFPYSPTLLPRCYWLFLLVVYEPFPVTCALSVPLPKDICGSVDSRGKFPWEAPSTSHTWWPGFVPQLWAVQCEVVLLQASARRPGGLPRCQSSTPPRIP